MKIKIILAPLLLLSIATGIYRPIKAITNYFSYQEKGRSSFTYAHDHIPSFDSTRVDSTALEKGLLKMHKEAVAAPYGNSDVSNILITYWCKGKEISIPEIVTNMITDYTATQRPVHFFIGAGKRMAIFALQGNKVSMSQEEEDDEEDDLNMLLLQEDVKSTPVFEQTISGEVPTVAYSPQKEKESPIVYYPGNHTQNMAFCDAEGFLKQRENISETEKCISAFAPFFALKANTIGGIVVVVSEESILSAEYDELEKSAHFLRQYFSAAGHRALKKSVLLMITRCETSAVKRRKVEIALRNKVQKSYQAYFKALGKKVPNSNDNKQAQHTHTDDTGIATLQPFFSMLLEKPVGKGEEDEQKNFRFDNRRMLFFDPCSQKSIQKTFKKLYTLQSLDHRYLCHFDNPLSQYLRKQILAIGDEVKKEANSILELKQCIKRQALQLEPAKSEKALQPLINKLESEIGALKQKNQAHKKDDSLICVFKAHHIEKLDLDSKYVPSDDTTSMKIVKIVRKGIVRVIIGAVIGAVIGAEIENAGKKKRGVVGAIIGVVVGAIIGAIVGTGVLKGVKNSGLGYCVKTFSYSGDEPIYQIKATYENAKLHHITPKKNALTGNFDITKETNGANIKYTATAKSTSIKQDTWEFKHTSYYFKDANCQIKMYTKKNELASTRKLIADNLKKIKEKKANIAACSQGQDNTPLSTSYVSNQQKLISQRKATFDMLNTWAGAIFRPDSQDLALLKSYLSDFASAAELPLAIIPTSRQADLAIKQPVSTNGSCLIS